MSPLCVLKFGLLHKPDSIFKLILEVNSSCLRYGCG